MFKNTPDGIPIFTFKEKVLSLTSYQINLADRLEKLSPPGYCNLTKFRIDKVVDGNTNNLIPVNLWKTMYSISDGGDFSILDFSKPYRNYQVYVAPFNGYIWGDFSGPGAQWVADITIEESDFIPPNIAPQFSVNISTSAYEIDLADSTTSQVEYSLPSVFDTNETQKVTVSLDMKGADISQCMTFDQSLVKAVFKKEYCPIGSYVLSLTVKDD